MPILLFFLFYTMGASVIAFNQSIIDYTSGFLETDIRIFFAPLASSIVILLYWLSTIFLKIGGKTVVIDSYYYLGFLFTLTTMVSVFHGFFQDIGIETSLINGDAERQPVGAPPSIALDDTKIALLISQNGVALLTTVIGMLLRLMSKMRIELKTKESPIEIVELKLTKQQIDDYNTLFLSLSNYNDSIQSLVNAGALSAQISTNLDQLNRTMAVSNSHIDSFKKQLQDMQKNAGRANSAATSAISDLLNSIRAARNSVDGEKTAMMTDISNLLNEIRSALKDIESNSNNMSMMSGSILDLYTVLNSKIESRIREKNASGQQR